MAIRITHVVVEVLRDGDPKARITHAVVEVLRASEVETESARKGDFFLVM